MIMRWPQPRARCAVLEKQCFKLEEGRKKKLFMLRVVNADSGFPERWWMPPCWEVFQVWSDRSLSNLL